MVALTYKLPYSPYLIARLLIRLPMAVFGERAIIFGMEHFNRCPFCSSGDLMMVTATYEIGYYVCCLDCESQGPVGESVTLALEKWETRGLYAEITYV